VRNGAAANRVLLVVRLSLSKMVSLVGSVTIAVHADGVADRLPAAAVIAKAIAKAIAKSFRTKPSQKTFVKGHRKGSLLEVLAGCGGSQ